MRALIITGKYGQDIEIFYPLYRLDEEGWKVDLYSLQGETTGVYGMRITPTRKLPIHAALDNYNVLILPGGARAMEYLRQDEEVIDFIKKYHKFDTGVIGSICHGTQLLISAGLVKGRGVSGYYSIKDDIVNAGGTFYDSPFVTDGKIVSSPHYKFLGPWMKEVIRVANLSLS